MRFLERGNSMLQLHSVESKPCGVYHNQSWMMHRVKRITEFPLGKCTIPIQGLEKRLNFKPPVGQWYNLEKRTVSENGQKTVSRANIKVQLSISLDGGYHVLDELTHYSSNLKLTARQLWKPATGVLELGILNAQNLMPMKAKDGRGVTDAHCVAKYGPKWIRTRTILNSFNPKWNKLTRGRFSIHVLLSRLVCSIISSCKE